MIVRNVRIELRSILLYYMIIHWNVWMELK